MQNLRRIASNDHRVRFLDAIPLGEIVSVLAQYDILVVPSQWLETGPLVVYEAFSAGIPVLGSRLGGIAELVRDGVTTLHGKKPVNPSGGLVARGHPVGATGLFQICELTWQLRGEAGARQVPDARVGLTHNNSGMGEHVVMIYGREA